jgi:hypothetical protein
MKCTDPPSDLICAFTACPLRARPPPNLLMHPRTHPSLSRTGRPNQTSRLLFPQASARRCEVRPSAPCSETGRSSARSGDGPGRDGVCRPSAVTHGCRRRADAERILPAAAAAALGPGVAFGRFGLQRRAPPRKVRHQEPRRRSATSSSPRKMVCELP